MQQESVEGVTDRRPRYFCIDDDITYFLKIFRLYFIIDVDVDDTCSRLNSWDECIFSYKIDERLASSWYDYVD